ncbi:MAG: hypothetical protein VYE29_00205 [Pseudomonadota bacterium]|nr:hypothetical protein [Pseudomonadota bacterium]
MINKALFTLMLLSITFAALAGQESQVINGVRFSVPMSAEEQQKAIERKIARDAAMKDSQIVVRSYIPQLLYPENADKPHLQEQLSFAREAFTHLSPDAVAISDGTKVLVEEVGSTVVVTVETFVPEGFIGADFAAQVTLDKESKALISVLGSR